MKKLLALLLVLSGCGHLPPGRVAVSRVFMHDPNHYTVMYSHGDEVRTKEFRGQIRVLADVKNGNPMWVDYGGKTDDGLPYYSSCTIHVHTVADVGGAEWESGKHSKGMTKVIE